MNERLTLEIVSQATGQDSVDRLTTAMNRFAASSETAAATSTRAFSSAGNAIGQHFVPQVAAASAAVRAFEGTLSVRAVERFLTSTLNLGGVLQKIFPVIGALAFIDVLVKGGEEVVKFYQKWDPVHQAQERSVELAKSLDKEIQKLGEDLQALNFENLEKAIGKTGTSSFRAQAMGAQIQGAQNLLGATNGEIASDQQRIKAGTSYNYLSGTHYSADAEAAKIELKDAQKRQSDLTLIIEKGQAEQSKALMDGLEHQQDLTDTANQTAIDKAKQAAEKLAEQRKRAQSVSDSEIERSIKDPVAKAFYSANSRLSQFDDPQSRAQVASAGISQIASASQELQKKTIEEQQKAAEQVAAADQKAFSEMLRERIRTGEEAIAADKQVIALQDSLTRENGTNAVRKATNAGAFSDRMISINPQLDEGQKIAALNQRDLETAREKYEIEKETASQLLDSKAKADAYNQAELNNELELQKIKEEGIERITELQNKQLETFKSTIGSALDSLMNHSFGNFLKSQATGLGKTITENAAAEYLYPTVKKLIPHAADSTSGIGKLLQGTPFGADPVKAATDLNTAATISNTTAIADLYAAITGNADPNVPSSSRPTIAASGSLASVFGGSTSSNPFIFSGFGTQGGNDVGGNIGDGLPMSAGNYGAGATPMTSVGGSSGGPLAGSVEGPLFNSDASTSSRVGSGVATAGVVAAGTQQAVSGFSKGGAKGTLSGISGVTGTAAALDPEPVSKTVLATVALVTGLVSSMLPDPAKLREEAINKEIQSGQYNAPTALNATMTTNGNFSDIDAHGMLRTSNFSGIPTVSEPYTHWHGGSDGTQGYYQVPGQVLTPYGAPTQPAAAPVPPVIVNISAIDAGSFNDFAQRNHSVFGDAVASHLQSGDTRLQGAIKYVTSN